MCVKKAETLVCRGMYGIRPQNVPKDYTYYILVSPENASTDDKMRETRTRVRTRNHISGDFSSCTKSGSAFCGTALLLIRL